MAFYKNAQTNVICSNMTATLLKTWPPSSVASFSFVPLCETQLFSSLKQMVRIELNITWLGKNGPKIAKMNVIRQ